MMAIPALILGGIMVLALLALVFKAAWFFLNLALLPFKILFGGLLAIGALAFGAVMLPFVLIAGLLLLGGLVLGSLFLIVHLLF